MPVQLLQTKLYAPPLRDDLVRRPHLVKPLYDGLRRGHRLTLISAPAGYGKTTAGSEWLQSVERPISWLSLDETDNDLAVFLAYLIEAMQQIDERIGRTVQMALETAETPPPLAMIPSLLNDIASTTHPFFLVLDDYRLLHAEVVHEAVELLIQRQPPQMHPVILTREDPPLPLPLLRVRDDMTELDQRDLRFTGNPRQPRICSSSESGKQPSSAKCPRANPKKMSWPSYSLAYQVQCVWRKELGVGDSLQALGFLSVQRRQLLAQFLCE